jgi:hypothetical protein
LILTADAAGVVWAPDNPGGLTLDLALIGRTSIATPVVALNFSTHFAYTVSFPLPAALHGQTTTIYLDLFDNLNAPNSLGWADDITVALVPEPSVLALGLFGLALMTGRTRPRAP